ncbi:MAG: Mammalian cell entry related domain protein [Sphingomonas bacterium]|jgi:phospholipid/cholesterol/gamma-HCH transport system substrate-binding protein|nr:MlaD family protein [Sphingomonas bacterium]MDB5689778.1 Mammalian cell entry related domain protein [Sphingomonas bacterium]
MENRSNNVLVGGVMLALLAITLGFIVWLAGFSGPNDQKYDIFFKTSVDGLAKGSGVTFAGVPVGKVDEISLMPESPEFVRIQITVKEGVPILQGTTAQIAGVGFTGVSQINLDGAIKGAPPITAAGPYGNPVIPTKPGALGELLSSAPQLLERISTLTERLGDTLSPANQKSITGILANAERLSGYAADSGPEMRATLAEMRVTIRQAGNAAQQLSQLASTTNGVFARDLGPTMANLNRAVGSAQSSLANIDTAVNDARPGLKAFSTQTIPEVSALIRDLTEMSEALTAVAGRLDRGGAGALIGGSKLPDYEPRK